MWREGGVNVTLGGFLRGVGVGEGGDLVVTVDVIVFVIGLVLLLNRPVEGN